MTVSTKIPRCNWTVTLDLPEGIEIKFRYVVCCLIDSIGEDGNEAKKVVVRRWETSLRPRKIGCHGNCIFMYFFTALNKTVKTFSAKMPGKAYFLSKSLKHI